jgi:hypothetical protein
MLKGFLKDHLKRHRQEKKKPAAAETDPGSSPAIHRSADSNFNGNTSGTKEVWYRDADGDLWLGPPSERDKHIVDAPLSKSIQPSKTVPFPHALQREDTSTAAGGKTIFLPHLP